MNELIEAAFTLLLLLGVALLPLERAYRCAREAFA